MLRGFLYHSADDGQTDGGTNAQTGTEPTKTERTFTQAELEAIVKDRLERQKRASEAQAEKTRQDAEAKALAEQGEFKALAEQHAARIAELEQETEASKALAKERDRYQAALKKHLDSQRADLPPHITALLDRLDVADQLDWLADNRAALQTIGDGVGSPANGTKPKLPADTPALRKFAI